MTAQPNLSQFGAPPGPSSGTSRVLSRFRGIATGGALVSVVAMGLQVVMPEGYRPSDILGSAGGLTEKYEILQKQDTKIEFERRLADATAQANAKAQADVIAMQKVLEERTASLQPVSTMAGIADLACLGGSILAGLTAPTGAIQGDWRRQSNDVDWHGGAVDVAKSTCGVGDRLRANVSQSQLDAVRTAAAARGAPMTNGATQTVPVTAPALRGRSTQEMNELRAYVVHQPVAVRRALAHGFDSATGDMQVYFDRVALYRDAHPDP